MQLGALTGMTALIMGLDQKQANKGREVSLGKKGKESETGKQELAE